MQAQKNMKELIDGMNAFGNDVLAVTDLADLMEDHTDEDDQTIIKLLDSFSCQLEPKIFSLDREVKRMLAQHKARWSV